MALYLDGQKIISGGGGSGGHTIVDGEGVSLEQRTNLQFNGTYSEDNATDDTTEINVVREMTKAEFDELTEDEKTGLINITDVTANADDKFQPIIYSGEEREVGVWINGKPLYQKTLTCTTDTNIGPDAWTTMPWDEEPENIDMLVTGQGHQGDVPSSYATPRVAYTGGHLKMAALYSSTFSAGKRFTVWYTKTTDTAGSGTWTPQGVPAVHYSADEHIVGTWIDGSTLYEKTYHNSAITIASNTELTIDDFTDKFPISCNGVLHNLTDYRTYYPNYSYAGAEQANIYYKKDGIGNLVLRSESDSWGNTWEVFTTVRYTKSST